MSKDKHDVTLTNDGWGVLLQILRSQPEEKIERRYIKKGGQVELMIDDMLWENPRPTIDKPEADACKKITEVVSDAGKIPMVRAIAEIMEELGIE